MRLRLAIVLVALGGAAAAVATSLTAGFLEYPGWLALQRADLILGPVCVGLYWWVRRPSSRFGPLLVAFGFISAPMLLQGAREPLLYSIGVFWDAPFFLATIAIILAFPSGRLTGAVDRVILGFAAFVLLSTFLPYLLFSPQIVGGGPIARCESSCPDNAFFISAHPALLSTLGELETYGAIAVAVALAATLLIRLLHGTPPRRRALASGALVGFALAVSFAAYQVVVLRAPDPTTVHTPLQWSLVVARSLLAYGFLAALIQAQLFAGRVLRRIVAESLHHPSLGEVEAMLARSLGDPRLRLGVWLPQAHGWVDGDGRLLEPTPQPSSRRAVTEVRRDGGPDVILVHDAELADDPELIQTAGSAALLALENARLEVELHATIRELRSSRARLVTAGDAERRKLERDLHDGAQQQLLALRLKLSATSDLASGEPVLHKRLAELGVELEQAVEEIRQLAHGIYPPVLADAGLVRALDTVAATSSCHVKVHAANLGRYDSAVESAVYYCCLEAIQNATKHAAASLVTIRLGARDGTLRFEIRDDGAGFDTALTPEGAGIVNMRDRLNAIGGRVEVTSVLRSGTAVSGIVRVG